MRIVQRAYPLKRINLLRRPETLSTDDADLGDVCKHCLENSPKTEFLSLLMPTYPFRKASRLADDIAKPVFSRQVDIVCSVRNGNYSTYDYWIQIDGNYERMFTGAPLWCGAGNAAYVLQKRDHFFLPQHKWPNLLGERTLRIQTDFKESLDIDTTADFEDAQKICDGYMPHPKKVTIIEKNDLEIVAPQGIDPISFLQFLKMKGINNKLPMLILQKADPLFTFLRWYECNASKNYSTKETIKIMANLPVSGHSQDVPKHNIHSPNYRVSRTKQDKNGILDDIIPASQVIFEEDIKREWPGYIDPNDWRTGTIE